MNRLSFGALAVAAACALDAAASCGAAFCVVNTDWTSQGAFTDEGLRLDLRYERIDLDRPRAGSERVAVGESPRHHDEVETRNRNWIAGLDWNFAPRWGLDVSLPWVDRDHLHVHNHHGERLAQAWSFRAIGDARVQVRRAVSSVADDASASRTWGFSFGVKLPTGEHDVANAEGAQAERSLQPGTGTTDALVGAFLHGAAPLSGWSWFTRAHAVLPMNSRDGYKPGRQAQLDAGVRRAIGDSLAAMLQLNAHWKGRDAGENAEPEDSGQRAVFASPGLSWSVARDTQLHAFVQLPLYQHVNGVQLTARWSAVAGASTRF